MWYFQIDIVEYVSNNLRYQNKKTISVLTLDYASIVKNDASVF